MKRFLYIKLFFFLVCITPYIAMADYVISPVKVSMNAKDKVASITLKNGNDDEASFQLALYKWSRVNGEDVYEESNEFTVTPKVFKVGSGDSQLIRVAPKSASRSG